jgi:flagellar motility protein MotE (MotC chaperone)
MDMEKKTNQTEKELGIGKILLVIFIVFIITPMIIVGIIYYTNDNFRLEANKYLVVLPGPLGEHFKSYPTRTELDKQKVSIAKYLTQIDNNRAIDKLTLIKNEDEVLYNDIIKLMIKLNGNKTKVIMDEIRNNLVKKDVLLRTVEQIDVEKENEILEKAKYLESLTPITAINEIEADIEEKRTTYSELATIFESIKAENAVNLLRHMDEGVREKIIDNFGYDEKKREIKVLLSTINDNESKLKYASEIYLTENPEKLVSIIGNTATYKIDDLAVIYKNIGVIKGAQILAKLEDDNFVHELVNEIKEREILSNDEDLLTEDLLKAYKIYRDFDKNVKELTSIYEKMEDRQIAELIKRMIRNSTSTKKYTLNSGESISISDEDLALTILKEFNERKLAAVLSNLDNTLASDVTKKLSLPNI